MLRQIPNKVLKRLFRETLAHPVKAGAEVIYKLLPWMLLSDFAGEFGGALDIGIFGLDPQQICVGSELFGAFRSGGHAGFVVVESLAGAGDVPVEEDGFLGVFVCYLSALEQR